MRTRSLRVRPYQSGALLTFRAARHASTLPPLESRLSVGGTFGFAFAFGTVRFAHLARRIPLRNQLGCATVTDSVTLRIVIKTFRHKGLAALFESGNAHKVQPKHAKRLNLILTALNAATQAAQMAMPGMRFHPLHGNRYSVWVDENYRVTFRFDGGHAYEVDYEDYH